MEATAATMQFTAAHEQELKDFFNSAEFDYWSGMAYINATKFLQYSKLWQRGTSSLQEIAALLLPHYGISGDTASKQEAKRLIKQWNTKVKAYCPESKPHFTPPRVQYRQPYRSDADYQRDRQEFFDSRQWATLRYQALRTYGRKCQCCYAEGVEMHVDHILPISKHWDKRHDFSNLQVLCKDCNIGKSNLFQDDWRPAPLDSDIALLFRLLAKNWVIWYAQDQDAFLVFPSKGNQKPEGWESTRLRIFEKQVYVASEYLEQVNQ